MPHSLATSGKNPDFKSKRKTEIPILIKFNLTFQGEGEGCHEPLLPTDSSISRHMTGIELPLLVPKKKH